MTSKERRYVRKLEIRIEELKKARERSGEIYLNQLHELVDRSCAMREVCDGLLDMIMILRNVMKNDPAFMHQFGKKQIEADF